MSERDRTEGTHAQGGRPARPRLLWLASDERLVAWTRRGSREAFEVLYERHAGELLAFCSHMLACEQDAQDALQCTFASAHRALVGDERRIALRPWLFAIARNACLSTLRTRRATSTLEQDGAAEATGARYGTGGVDPVARAERSEDLRELLAGLRELPERQRAALVLVEVHGLSHRAVAAVLDLQADQVKSHVFQARAHLLADRDARATDCAEIRAELVSARGAALRRRRLRRHLHVCEPCRTYAASVSRQRRTLNALLGLLPATALRRRILDPLLSATGGDGTVATATVGAGGASLGAMGAEIAGGGTALVAKLAAGIALLGVGTGVGGAVLASRGPESGPRHASPAAGLQLVAHRGSSVSWHRFAGAVAPLVPGVQAQGTGSMAGRGSDARRVALVTPSTPSGSSGAVGRALGPGAQQGRAEGTTPHESGGATGPEGQGGRGGKSGEGKSGEAHGQSGEAPGQGGEAHGQSSEAHGKSGEAPGRQGEAPGQVKQGTGSETHGRSAEAPGRQGEAPPGHQGEAPGHQGEAPPGHQGEAPRQAKEGHGAIESHGKSAEAPGHQSAEAHGGSGSAMQPTGGPESTPPSQEKKEPSHAPGGSGKGHAEEAHGGGHGC